MMRSPCCNAAVHVEREDEGWTFRSRAWWYACTACGQPCEPVEVDDDGKEVGD